MKNKNENFAYAQSLFNQYSTIYSNDTLENNLVKIFDGNITHDYFIKNNLNPREFINQFILYNYPNETSVKSSFIDKVLLKSNNHVTIFELNVGKSRIDLCKINGSSEAFEIKTDLDSPKRLKQQMDDYFKVFEKVNLICSKKNLNIMMHEIPENCGIYTYYITKTGRYIYKRERKAVISDSINSYNQISIFTKRDLGTYFNCVYSENKEKMLSFVLENFTDKEINKIFKVYLKNKYKENWNFLLNNKYKLFEIDYQWFYKNLLPPEIVYH